MRRLSPKQEAVLFLCGNPGQSVARVFERYAGKGAPYSWSIAWEHKCTQQTTFLRNIGYIVSGDKNENLQSRPWLLTDRGREYVERFGS